MDTPVQHWIKNHDERWTFILLYVGSAVVLSIYANLFWVVMLMLGHFGLEIWRHVIMQVKKPLLQALWHVKLDIALVLFALVITLYAELVMAALGLGQAARAGQAVHGAQMLTRFAIIERGLRIFFLTVDDMARVAHILWKVFKKKNGGYDAENAMEMAREKLQEEEEHIHGKQARWKLSKGDIFSLGFGGVCLALILLAPVITGIGITGTASAVIDALHP